MNLIWLRSDLRTYDNPALTAACAAGPTVAAYFLTPEQWDEHVLSPWKKDLIVRQLRALAEDLASLNIPLVVENAGSFKQVPAQLAELARARQANTVFWNREYEVNEARCAANVQQALEAQGVATRQFDDQCVIEPGRVLTQAGDMFKVYSAFRRAWLQHYPLAARPLATRPAPQGVLKQGTDLRALDGLNLNVEATAAQRWPAGESAALARLQRFADSAVHDYAKRRDEPAAAATSEISPYLNIGAISIRQCLQAALNANEGRVEGGQRGVEVWINELLWREFYRHLLAAFPRLCMHQPFLSETDRLPWRHDRDLFKRWCEGQTGFPIVDAAMRQLKQTGWMHNRLRMICAMFLTKDLFIDWRWGERYFMQNLVDGDLASNNGGWQWSASTGVDAAPYFRIFNPARQSERFDAEGDYIRTWVPELAKLDSKSIHQPSSQQGAAAGYVPPLVNHASASAEAKRLFQTLGREPNRVLHYHAAPTPQQEEMF